jgi:hypothetical protein
LLRGNLLITDSEVEKLPVFAGKNVFEATLQGELQDAYNVLGFTHEPNGIAQNTLINHIFIADDDQRRIFEIDPGNDNRIGTSDDVISSIDTLAFGSDDPEGVAYGDGGTI